MKIQVELWAFKEGQIREVEIPDKEYDKLSKILEAAFLYGQNDFQPQPLPSVSVGDVINYEGKKYRVQSVGFKEMTKAEYEKYKALPHLERMFYEMD